MNANILNILQNQSIYFKILFLIISGFLLYFSALFIADTIMLTYFIVLFLFVLIVATICRLAIGKNLFNAVLLLWAIGTSIYMIIGISRVYSGAELSPYISYTNILSRWLYIIAHPIRLLGTFSIGLIFIKISSPIEFLHWGKVGLYMALLLRTTQYSTEKFSEVRMALLMQNKWPDNNQKIIQLKNALLSVKYAPILVAVTFRSIIQWFPWAWISFNKLHLKINGGKS